MARILRNLKRVVISSLLALIVAACGTNGPPLPSADFVLPQEGPGPNYLIGPLDTLNCLTSAPMGHN